MLATWYEELTHWKRPWCWERLKAGGERDGRGWDDWMASLTRWTWVWTSSRSWWWTGKPGMLQSLRSQRVGHNWATEVNWSPGKRNKNENKQMGPNKPRKLLHSQDNHQQNEKTTYRMGENIHKWCDQLGLNFQNIQTALTTRQTQSKNGQKT